MASFPQKVLDDSPGNPKQAGRAYAINIFGGIMGPLFASYLLLPQFGSKITLVILGIFFLLFSLNSFIYCIYYFFTFLLEILGRKKVKVGILVKKVKSVVDGVYGDVVWLTLECVSLESKPDCGC